MYWRAYGDRVSRYRRCPSANRTSNARVLFPLPLGPVTTTSWSRGMCTVMFLRLCSRAPAIRISRSGAVDAFVFFAAAARLPFDLPSARARYGAV